MSAHAARQVANLAQRGIWSKGAAGIVQVGQHNQFCSGWYDAADFSRLQRVPALFASGKALHRRAQIQEGGGEQLIGRMLE